MRHDVGATAESRHGHAAANDFAEGGDVGCHAVNTLCTLGADTEARHHLVNDKHGPILGAQVSQSVHEFRCGADKIHIACNGFKDDGCKFIAFFFE